MATPVLLLITLYLFRILLLLVIFFFFFNDTATTEIYTLSLHDALPIYEFVSGTTVTYEKIAGFEFNLSTATRDRKSTRLNSSHTVISYAVFCLKKKKQRAVYELLISMMRVDIIIILSIV